MEDIARLRQLDAATAALSCAATPAQVAQVAVERFERLLGTPSVAVFELRGRDSLDAMTLGGWAQGARDQWTTMPLDAPAPVAEAARTLVPVWSESAAAWQERFPHLVGMLDGYGYTGVLGLPMLVAGELVGALGVGFTEDRVLDVVDRAAVQALAGRCAEAMSRARLLDVESASRRTAVRFSAMVAALSRARTPQQVVAAIGEAASSLGATASVVATTTGNGVLDLAGTAAGQRVAATLPADAAHPLATAVRTGEPVWLARRSELAWRDRSFTGSPDDDGAVDVSVPMVVDDRAVGAIGLVFGTDVPYFSREEREAVLTLAGQCAQALDRARLQQVEHDIADTLQRSLLPDRLPEPARLAVDARYLPGTDGTQAGGDWYDVIELDGSSVAMVVGDVVGKGPVAAGLMGRLRTALAVSLLRGDGPAAALHQLDRFAARIPAARASTAACVLVDWATGEVTWSSAGHPPPLLVSGGGPRLLDGAVGPVLGITPEPGSPHPEARTVIGPGDSLVLYTDGLVERRDETLREGLDRLLEAAARLPDRPPAELADGLLDELLDPVGPVDDVALVLCRAVPPPWTARIRAAPEELRGVRRGVQEWGVASGLSDDHVYDLQVAVGEAVANGVEHAYRDRPGGEVTIDLARRGDGAVDAGIADAGTWRPPPDDPGFRGRGLAVIEAVASDVRVQPGADGTCVAFRVPPEPDRTPARRWRRDGAVPEPTAELMGSRVDDALHLHVRGDLDLAGVGRVRDALRAAVGAETAGGRVVLDLTGTGYVASAGVALLLETVELAARHGLDVRAEITAGGALDRILTLTGVGALLPT